MGKSFTTIVSPRGDYKTDHARREMLSSLVDGVARYPDGTPRNGRAGALVQEEARGRAPCEVSLALGIEDDKTLEGASA